MRRSRAVLENNKQENANDQRSDSDVKAVTNTSVYQELTRTCVDQTSLSVKAREHSDTETLKHKKKKKLHDTNLVNDGNSDIVTTSKKAKIIKSNNDAVDQMTENVCHAKHKKRGANVQDSGRKKKKRKVDCEDNKVEADVLSWKSESTSVNEQITDTTDSVEIQSPNSVRDLQGLEDSVVDDYVSANVVQTYPGIAPGGYTE